MKSICICGPFPKPVGGVSIHVKRLYKRFSDIFIVNLIDESPCIKKNIYNVRSFNFINYFILLRKSDLVHVNSSIVLFRFMHVLFSILMSKKVVVTVHSYRKVNFLYKILNAFSFRNSNVNIVVSKEISNVFPFDHVIIPAFICPSDDELVLDEKFCELVSKIKKTGKKIAVSNAYRLDFADGRDIYGFMDLLLLFRDAQVNNQYVLIMNVSSLVGCLDKYQSYKRFISENNLDECIYLFNENLSFSGLLQHADVFIRATSTDGDALSVRESLLFGVKTIASDCVSRPQGTILYKDGDIFSLKQAILFGEIPAISDSVSFENQILEIYKGLL